VVADRGSPGATTLVGLATKSGASAGSVSMIAGEGHQAVAVFSRALRFQERPRQTSCFTLTADGMGQIHTSL